MIVERGLCEWTPCRYRALFTLRDLRVPAATAAVARALREDSSSALLRHEIAFVLGQIQFPQFDGNEPGEAAADAVVSREPEAGKSEQEPFPAVITSANAAASESAQALVYCLSNPGEHSMARHEAALALGSLGADPRASTCECGGESVRNVVLNAL